MTLWKLGRGWTFGYLHSAATQVSLFFLPTHPNIHCEQVEASWAFTRPSCLGIWIRLKWKFCHLPAKTLSKPHKGNGSVSISTLWKNGIPKLLNSVFAVFIKLHSLLCFKGQEVNHLPQRNSWESMSLKYCLEYQELLGCGWQRGLQCQVWWGCAVLSQQEVLVYLYP